MRDVGHEAPAHGLVLFESRHVAENPDGRGARAWRQGSDGELPRDFALTPHDRVGRRPVHDCLFKGGEESLLPQDLDERSPRRVRRAGHRAESPVRVDHPVVRIDDHDTVGEGLENGVREPPLSFDPGD